MQKVTRIVGLCLVATIGLTGCAAQDGPPITEVKSAAALQEQMTAGVMVIHALDAEHYAKGHVPGAINIDYEKMTPEMLPAEKNKSMVFYCAGGMCPVGRMAANKARSWGYTNVSVYEGGIKDWRAAGMKVEAGSEPRP